VCRCIAWLRACGNEALLTRPLTTLQGNKYLVCQDHFLKTDYIHSKGLGPQSVPSVFHHNGPLSQAAIEDYCIRNNVVIPVDPADNKNQAVELDPFVDHAYSKYLGRCHDVFILTWLCFRGEFVFYSNIEFVIMYVLKIYRSVLVFILLSICCVVSSCVCYLIIIIFPGQHM